MTILTVSSCTHWSNHCSDMCVTSCWHDKEQRTNMHSSYFDATSAALIDGTPAANGSKKAALINAYLQVTACSGDLTHCHARNALSPTPQNKFTANMSGLPQATTIQQAGWRCICAFFFARCPPPPSLLQSKTGAGYPQACPMHLQKRIQFSMAGTTHKIGRTTANRDQMAHVSSVPRLQQQPCSAKAVMFSSEVHEFEQPAVTELSNPSWNVTTQLVNDCASIHKS